MERQVLECWCKRQGGREEGSSFGTTGHSCRPQSSNRTIPPTTQPPRSTMLTTTQPLFWNGSFLASWSLFLFFHMEHKNQRTTGSRGQRRPLGREPKIWDEQSRKHFQSWLAKLCFHKKFSNSTDLELDKENQFYTSPTPRLTFPCSGSFHVSDEDFRNFFFSVSAFGFVSSLRVGQL